MRRIGESSHLLQAAGCLWSPFVPAGLSSFAYRHSANLATTTRFDSNRESGS
jgi:hypothetical protein